MIEESSGKATEEGSFSREAIDVPCTEHNHSLKTSVAEYVIHGNNIKNM